MARILLIDDNDEFRTMLSAVLKQEGYVVIEAVDGREGATLYRHQKPDLIITDMNMPDKSGPELIFELQKEFPGVKIIAVSGGSVESEGYLKDIMSMSDVKFTFTKPFEISDLLKAARTLLAS